MSESTSAVAPLSALRDLLARRWLLLGIGNDLRADDGFGPLLARRLQRAGLPALDAGSAPENLTGPIRRAAPDVLLLADATHVGAAPGSMRLLPPDVLVDAGTSTHDPGLRLLLSYLAADSDMETHVLAVQPRCLTFAAPMTDVVSAAVDELVQILTTEHARARAGAR